MSYKRKLYVSVVHDAWSLPPLSTLTQKSYNGGHKEVRMKHVGVREFKNKATSLIAEGENLVIEKHGKPVGFYLPIKVKDRSGPEIKASVERLDALMADILARTGMSEDEFIAELTEDWQHQEDNPNDREAHKVA